LILGVGIDLIDLDHFRTHYGDEDPELLERCFMSRELEQVDDGVNRIASLAARFAAKEAVYKALGGDNVALTDVETLRASDGSVMVQLHGAAAAIAAQKGVERILISLTHSPSSAAAVAIAIAGPR
jgi:holo-[acyl-carrier protein] synthase